MIVEGVVDSSTFKARQPNHNNPIHIESDVVFLVSRVFKGNFSAQKTFPRVVISQTGGTFGNKTILPPEPLMEQGERQILFLVADNRSGLPSIAGLPRYLVVGIWSGKFRIQGNKIGVSHKALPGLHAHDAEDYNVFVAAVSNAVRASHP